MATVTTASSEAGTSTGGMSAGSVDSPKKTKNTAANRSRSGLNSRRVVWATSPESAMPTRKAPTAADTCSCWATPATSSVRPRTTSSSISGLSEETALLISRPCRSAPYSARPAEPSAMASVTLPLARLTPATAVVRIGRYSAMIRSSITRIPRITGVSRLPSRSRSVRTLATTPEEEM